MNAQHEMELHGDNGTEQLFVCPHESCGRRLVLKRNGDLTVIEQGDFYAMHRGGTHGLSIGSLLP